MMLLPALFVVVLLVSTLSAHNVKDNDDSGIEPPLVQTSEGLIRGNFLTTYTSTRFYSFRSVRFAEPPIGENRFKVKHYIFSYFLYGTN